MVALLLMGMLTLAFNIQSVKGSRTIYIRADGSVEPPNTPISSVDNVTYTFTDNINDSIVVQRDNIVVDGAGYTVQGSGNGTGVDLSGRNNVTIKNANIKGFDVGAGIRLGESSNCNISGNNLSNNFYGFLIDRSRNNLVFENNISNNFYGFELLYNVSNSAISSNNITNNVVGIYLDSLSKNNVISGNNVTNNGWGVELATSYNNTIFGNDILNNRQDGISLIGSFNNKIYHNNVVGNGQQVDTHNAANVWDDGYPSGGNYWSNYVGVDLYRGPYQNITGSDGIGDTPYVIDASNQDNYPLMTPWLRPWCDWRHYHNYTEIVRTLLYLNETYPTLVDVFSIGKSWQDRDIYCVRLTNEANTHPKPEVFFVGYHHAREVITAELALYFVVDAVTNYGTNATITRMLNYSEIYVVVALNVDGFDLFAANDWQRKNARPTDEDNDGRVDEDPPEDEDGDGFIEQLGNITDPENPEFIRWEGIDNDGDGKYAEDWIGGIDLNRNYDYAWAGGVSSPRSDLYKGPAPFSEPETQAIRDLELKHNFTYAISFHSGVEMILYPWGNTKNPPPDEAKFIEISEDLSNITGGTLYMQASDLYFTYGAWDDWMYGVADVFALTCEIFTNETWEGVTHPGPYPNTTWSGGLRYSFNPFPSGIETVIQRWLPVFTCITNRTINEAYDLAVTNVTTSKTVVGQGFSFNVNVTVENQGYLTELFNVTLYANTTAVGRQMVIDLAAGETSTLTFAWNTTGFAKGNYTISAYASSVPGEADTTDNTLTDGVVTVAMVGDMIVDGTVDTFDLYALATWFGSNVPPAPPDCDIIEDNVIDIFDLVTIAVNYGQTDP